MCTAHAKLELEPRMCVSLGVSQRENVTCEVCCSQIPEEGTDGLSDVDVVRDGNMGGGLASPYPFLGAAGYKSCMVGNWTRFFAYVRRALSFVLFLLIAEKNRLSFVYVLAMYMAIQAALFPYASGRSTDNVMALMTACRTLYPSLISL